MFSMMLSRRSRTSYLEGLLLSLRRSYHLIYHTLPKSAPNLESDKVPWCLLPDPSSSSSAPEGFTPLIILLSTPHHSCIPITLPSTRVPPRHLDFSQDVATIRKTFTTLADDGKDVVVVILSNGNVPGSSALLKLSRAERQKEGKEGGVIRLVFIGIFLREDCLWDAQWNFSEPEPRS
jgi:hypothetical protein